MQRQQEYEANVFARMFKQAIAPKQLKSGNKSRPKGGFATQRAYGIDPPKASKGSQGNGDKPEKQDASEKEGASGKRQARSKLFSLLNKD